MTLVSCRSCAFLFEVGAVAAIRCCGGLGRRRRPVVDAKLLHGAQQRVSELLHGTRNGAHVVVATALWAVEVVAVGPDQADISFKLWPALLAAARQGACVKHPWRRCVTYAVWRVLCRYQVQAILNTLLECLQVHGVADHIGVVLAASTTVRA